MKESINLYNEWFEIFHKEKPCKSISKYMDSVHYERTFAEKISSDYEKKNLEDNSFRWYSKALKYCEQVKDKFMSVLKFPLGGWMCDIKDLDDSLNGSKEIEMNEENMNIEFNETVNENTRNVETKRRKIQMEELRKFYLPNMCFILLDMMTKMNLNKDLIRLSELIACETYNLYSLFDNQQLKILLNKIADSSIILLDSNKDYLGF